MIAVIGIDEEGVYKPAMRLLGRLSFEEPQWHLAHFQPPLVPWTAPGLNVPADEMANAMTARSLEAYNAVNDAADDACGYGINAKVHSDLAPPAAGLMEYASRNHADLVAIGSHQHGVLSSAFLGSVGRGLAVGADQSFLIGRGTVEPTGPVSAVFATDHSKYSFAALEWLINNRPKGLKRIHLLTAYDPSDIDDGDKFVELAEEARTEGRSHVELMRELSERDTAMLRAAGYEASYSLRPGSASKAIDRTMSQQSADLLILGAQGHGFFERLLIGSVALQQVVAGPHSVLVIRPRKS